MDREFLEIFVRKNHHFEIEDLKFGIWSKWGGRGMWNYATIRYASMFARIRTTDLASLLAPILNVM